MKFSIGQFEIVGHRPGNASRGVPGVAPVLTRAQRARDYLPVKWRRTPIIESIIRANLDEGLATPSTEHIAQENEPENDNENALAYIDHWLAQAPPEHRESTQRVADQIKAC
ncbi:hypothetical protein [Actimicrobium sp. CCI2.3]|uniref:hypothetical protein n=1 Tax=Actimicrobium sp. CCI2.3 TaxID=3048616 RepID=UPI002AB517A4|nr:hypothetical protein [Actimicrobium sp. CCI2.3]MDY7574688.1 hypothetical protein [Actimicrobium sp. CCI2.3]MEB0020356.1 hypothetical protein [Actimicrobium sp. CCI2.3]